MVWRMLCLETCFVFFHEMASQVRPHRRHRRGSGLQCLTLTGLRQGHWWRGGGGGGRKTGVGARKCLRTFVRVSMVKAGQGRVNSSGGASLNNFSGPWATGVVVRCLVSGPGMIMEQSIASRGAERGGSLALDIQY